MSWISNNTASEDWGLGNTSTLHSWVIGGVSILYNTLLIATILTKSSQCIGPYKYMMVYACLLNMAVSSVFIAVSPVIASMLESRSILFVQGGIQMPLFLGDLILAVTILVICQSIVSPCCFFYARYAQICRHKIISIETVSIVVSISMVISQIGGVALAVSAWPNATDDQEFGKFVWLYNIHRVGSFLVASLEPTLSRGGFQSRLLIFALIYLAGMVLVSWITMAVCWHKIVVFVGQSATSNVARNMHKQMKHVLLIQFLVPLIFVHLPFCLTCVAPLFYIATGGTAEAMPFVFAWGPLTDAIMVSICVKDYRRFIFAVCRKKRVNLHIVPSLTPKKDMA